MSRSIKFRAWMPSQKKMFSAEEMASDQMALLPDGHFANIHGVSTKLSQIYSHDEMLPLQFTGLLDKNGKEIYEGDVVKWSLVKGDIGEVVFDTKVIVEYRKEVYETVNEISGWYVREGVRQMFGLAGAVKDNVIEIIGNIYENIDLLKGIK